MKRALIMITVLITISVMLSGCTIPIKMANLISPGYHAAVQTSQTK